ncbi:hypothetical protein C0995_004366 [Termitomyces sp. Mi166|nr:hypothetical protein C0995_004366 [Termitomyces sp. Mi166\
MAPGFRVQDATRLGLLSISNSTVPWHSEHAIPIYVSIVSAGILFIHFFVASKYLRSAFTRLGWVTKSVPEFEETENHGRVVAHGGRVIFGAEVMRFIGSLELLRVSLLRVFAFGGWQNTELAFSSITFTYTSLLALFSVLYHRPTVVSRHISIILATVWIVYFIRDVVPLATYTRSPADPVYLLWELIGVLSFTGVILPLITPRRHVPFDSSDPMPRNPEQTASIFSLTLFSFLDPTVWKAYKAQRTSLSDLPPLADSDRAKHLIRAAFPHLDPLAKPNISKKDTTSPPRRHIFLAISIVFRKEIILAAFLLLCNITSTLTNPYGLKRLLEYLETKGEGATVKPWVWISSLCLAPFASTLIGQQYQRILARGTVHLEAILTQLILQHALRVRIVAEGKSESVTMEGSGQSAAAADAAKNLMGRMNNLISSDLQAITRGSEFMQVFFFSPFMVLLCVGFLYTILGWRYVLVIEAFALRIDSEYPASALVGFAVMVLMMPIPVQVAKMLSGAAKEVSTKGDERVEAVTETITVIRMIKMFGWEKKMAEQIDEKRKTELHWVWWNKIWVLSSFPSSFLVVDDYNVSIRFIIPAVTMCVTFSVYTELLDEFTPSQEYSLVVHPDEIGFCKATFSWSKEGREAEISTPSKRSFRLDIEDELLFQRDGFNLIIGPTGK